MKKENFTESQKEEILYELYNSKKPQVTISEKYNVSVSTIRKWRKEEELKKNTPRRKYFKIMEKIGIVLLVFAFVFIYSDKYIISIFLLAFAALFQIPEGYYFIKNIMYTFCDTHLHTRNIN